MISLDTLRPALLSANPYAEIDRLVRAELAAGRTTGQIFDDLDPLVDEARATPGLTEDGEEALFGALDALTGNCHPDCQYKDPPGMTSPTENGTVPADTDGRPSPSREAR